MNPSTLTSLHAWAVPLAYHPNQEVQGRTNNQLRGDVNAKRSIWQRANIENKHFKSRNCSFKIEWFDLSQSAIGLALPNSDSLELKEISFISAERYIHVFNISFRFIASNHSLEHSLESSEFYRRETPFF
jgi:hypothetical protein